MRERLRRTQLLLEPAQHRALADIAQDEGRSISEVVREMIDQQLESRAQATNANIQRQLEVLDRIRRQREAILAERGGKPLEVDVVDLIHAAREERSEQIIASITGQRD